MLVAVTATLWFSVAYASPCKPLPGQVGAPAARLHSTGWGCQRKEPSPACNSTPVSSVCRGLAPVERCWDPLLPAHVLRQGCIAGSCPAMP